MEKCEKRTHPIIYFIFVFLAIYMSHDTLLFGTNANVLFTSIRKVMPFLLIIGLFFLQRIRAIKWKTFFLLVGILVLPFLACVFNGEALDNYVYRCALMVGAIVLILSNRNFDFYYCYNKFMAFISIWSIAVFLIGNFLPKLISIFPTVVNISGKVYYNTFFSVASPFGSTYSLMRNQGIFRESGVFVVFLVVALLFELAVLPKPRTKYIFLFTITMLTTLSTAGYIILTLIFVYIILGQKGLKYKVPLIVCILIACFFIISQTNLLSLDSAMFSKFQEGSNTYGSFFARFSSLTENIKIALKNPLFGVGRYNLYDTILATSGNYEAVDNTNTFMINFAAYGILYGAVVMFGVWRFLRHRISRGKAWFWLLILFLTFSNEDLGQNIIFYWLVFEGLIHKDVARFEQEPKNLTVNRKEMLGDCSA